jgi:hypothetical protein
VTKPKPPWEDQKWVQKVREDLDSEAERWVKRSPNGQSKFEAICLYLDEVLRAAGTPGKCPTCGQETKP